MHIQYGPKLWDQSYIDAQPDLDVVTDIKKIVGDNYIIDLLVYQKEIPIGLRAPVFSHFLYKNFDYPLTKLPGEAFVKLTDTLVYSPCTLQVWTQTDFPIVVPNKPDGFWYSFCTDQFIVKNDNPPSKYTLLANSALEMNVVLGFAPIKPELMEIFYQDPWIKYYYNEKFVVTDLNQPNDKVYEYTDENYDSLLPMELVSLKNSNGYAYRIPNTNILAIFNNKVVYYKCK